MLRRNKQLLSLCRFGGSATNVSSVLPAIQSNASADGLFKRHKVYNGHTKKSKHLINVQKVMSSDSDWLDIGGFQVYPWSLSGVESSVVVKRQELCVVFDMGYATKESVKSSHVFISHGHLDHVSALIQHAGKRALYGMKPATYYLPPHLVSPIKAIADNFSIMHERESDFSNINIMPMDVHQHIEISHGWSVKTFPTFHSVKSQGYILYKKHRSLHPEYSHLTGPDIGQLVKQGVQVHNYESVPEIVYTGDTTFQLFENLSDPDVLRAKLLITESTYIDDEVDKLGHTAERRARDRGHCHLSEFAANAALFKNVNDILFVHFSDKYSIRYIKDRMGKLIPEDMKNKVHASLLMKKIFS